MLSIHKLILVSLRFASSIISPVDSSPTREIEGVSGDVQFQELLGNIPEESLNVALRTHMYPQFKDGVYERNRHALEAVRNTDAVMATKLLVAAKLDLLKRQAKNSTTSTSTSTANPIVVTVPVSTTDSKGSTVTSIATAVASATVSVTVQVTTTNSAGSTVVSASIAPAVVLTNANGQVTTSAAPVFTGGAVVMTETNARGSTFVTTFTPGGGLVSSLVLETTTLPDGSVSTITSFTLINSNTITGKPSSGPHLQNVAPSGFSISLALITLAATALGSCLVLI